MDAFSWPPTRQDRKGDRRGVYLLWKGGFGECQNISRADDGLSCEINGRDESVLEVVGGLTGCC